MRFKITLILSIYIVLIYPQKNLAQSINIGLFSGGSYYYGDIVNYSLQSESVKPSLGLFASYQVSPSISVRANLMYCRVFGADSNLKGNSSETKWQRDRNLAFYSDIFEVSGVMEYNFIKDNTKGGDVRNRYIPYAFVGIGSFYFEPKAIHPITGDPIELRPLKLNGVSYSPIALDIPLGIGFRCYVNSDLQIGLEMSARYTSTSYLHDIDGKAKYPDASNLPNDDARIMVSRNKNSMNPITQIGSNFSGKPRGKIDYINDLFFVYGITVLYKISSHFGRFY
jgi:hypothetical protein